MTQAQRVLIVDDHPVVRRGLRTMLENETWVTGVDEAATVADAVRAAVTADIGVVAMDLSLPDGDGVEATRQIIRLRPAVRILVLTMSDDDGSVARALRAGAHGYVLKTTHPDTIVDALRTVAGGGVVLGPEIGASILSHLQPAALRPPFDRLTPRERDLLAQLAGGHTNAAIARRLGVTEKTVRNQFSAVFAKLGVADRVQAALLAREAGIAP